MFEALSGVPDASRWLQIRNRLGTITRQKPGDVGAVDHERDGIEHDHSAQPETEASRSGNVRRTGDEAEDRAWSGRYTALWRKETGEWRVSRAIGLR